MSEEEQGQDETLPFEVEIERLPAWAHASSALVIVAGMLVATKVVDMLVVLPFLAVSSIGRRFASNVAQLELNDSGLRMSPRLRIVSPGERKIPRSEIVDVWVDDEEGEPRVTVAFGDDVKLVILHFLNHDQAKRFGGALAPKDGAPRHAVVGYAPRPVDWLSSLRFLAIAAAFFAAGSPALGAAVLGIFALGALNLLRAKQVVARPHRVELRTIFGVEMHLHSDIDRIDVDDGIIHLKRGDPITLSRSMLRDTTLGSGVWLERARSRVLKQIASSIQLPT